MTGCETPQGWLDHRAVLLIGAVALAIALLNVNPAVADGSRPLQLVSVPMAQSVGGSGEQGVLDRIGRWFDRSVTDLDEGLRETFGRVERSSGHTREAVSNRAARDPPGIPDVRIVTEHVPCPTAANGAPDCRRAAESVCRRKGFASGNSLETRSEEKCSLGALLARRAGQPDTCRNQTYVLRSVCQ